jgi:OmpA-OmpF porin, OOP family
MIMGAVAALSLTAQAQAMPDGWYMSLEGGGNWVQDWDFDSVTGFGTTAGSVSFDNGWAVLASVGYGRGNWAAEFEMGFRRNDSDEVTVDNVIDFYDDARLNETTFMANIKYNYPLAQKLTLSVGAGLGADYAELRVRDGATVTEDEDWNLAYQGIVSLGYAVGQRSELFASYRYFRTTAAEFDLTPALDAVFDGEEFQKHTATVGFRYYLNGGSEPEPMQAPPPPPPAEAGSPSEFIIFFGHNKAELTPAAMEVVREAASSAKENGVANVKLVGHADRSGSDNYNQALSLRRANTVKSALVREGVSESTIAVDGRGESEPLVPTADGVREPQNRRVNISF